MIKVAFVRGAYLNNFEGQNYIFDPKEIQLTAFASKYALHSKFLFAIQSLFSLSDLEHIPFLRDIKIYKKAVKYISNRTLGDKQILFGLEKYADQFDIFHSADPHYYYSYQLAKLRVKGKIKKLILTSWETIPFNNESTKAKKHIKYFSLQHADQILCYTEKAKQTLITEGIAQDKIIVIPLGIDLKKFIPIKKKDNKTLEILCVSRLVSEKGVFDVYEAFKNIVQNYKAEVTLRFVGEGELQDELQKRIFHDSLQHIISIEQKEYQDIPSVFQHADIFVLPSQSTQTWEEQYGMVFMEAMASGLPIIATKTGAIEEIIGDAGILIKEKNSEELQKALITLIQSSPLRKEIGEKAREKAINCYDAQRTIEKIGTMYELVLSI